MPTREEVVLTRSELYDLVWAKPMRLIGKEFGMSDVALAKWCKKLDIPRPGVGHWQKLQAGKKVRRPNLPEPERTDTFRLWVVRGTPGEEFSEPPPRELPEYELFEATPENQIVVPEQLERPHPLVARAQKLLSGGHIYDRYGWICPKEGPCLDINASPGTLDRCLLIMDTLLKALHQRGIEVGVTRQKYEKATTCAVVRAERVFFGMFESPQKGLRKRSWSKEMVQGMVPSGRLVLRIRDICADYVQIRDRKKRTVENRLNEFIARLHEQAIRQTSRRIEQERRRLEREESRRRDEELRRRKELETAKFQELESLVGNWRKAQDIREFLHAIKCRHDTNGGIEPGSALSDWLAWAQAKADELDPLVSSNSSREDTADLNC